MDIVNRIKEYMTAGQISSTQFADACGIPRPTLSQILGGRNKKISDEVISKIHEAYPDLSVMWLLFGEGEMLARPNIQISEPQQEARGGQYEGTGGVFSGEMGDDGGLFGAREDAAGESQEPFMFDDGPEEESTPQSAETPAGEPQPMVRIPADGSKSIVNIMVFYSDNSYQSFVPR